MMTLGKSDWMPLTRSEDSSSVSRIVTTIAEHIAADVLTDDWRDRATRSKPAGEIATREAGIAVFFIELASTTGDARFAIIARNLLAQATHRLDQLPIGLGLFSGATGVAWAVHYANSRNLLHSEAGDDADPVSEFDELLLDYVRESQGLQTDLMEGIAGLGTYALARLPRPTARKTVKTLCEHLWRQSEAVPGGRAWIGGSDYNTLEARPPQVEGSFPLGLAHGLAGIVGFLSRVVDRGFDFGARELLNSAVGSLLTAVGSGKRSPISPRMTDRRGLTWGAPSFTWCWGDLGVSLAVTHAGLTLRNHAWVDRGIMLARSAGAAITNVGGPPTPTGVADPSFCHGLAGPCHALNALSRMTGDRSLRAYSQRWRDALLGLRGDKGYGGYLFHVMTPEGGTELGPSAGFLMGSAGAGLALLATYTDQAPLWDALLQMDAPLSVGRATA
jgi:hypothetical protein